MPQLRNIFRAGRVLVSTAIIVACFVFNINFAEAIIGPSQPPGNGGGSLSVDANRNLGFNTSVVGTSTGATPPVGNFSNVFMIAATSSPPGIGLRSVASGCPSGGCYGQSLYSSTWVWRLTPWGFMELVNATDSGTYGTGPGQPLITFMGGNTYNRRVMIGDFYTSTSTMYDAALGVIGNIKSTGNVTAVGSFAGTTLAGNVASGLFGSLQGGGNFAFGNTLTVGTSTISNTPANGLYVVGNVGIGTTATGYKLDIAGNTNITSGYLRFESGNTEIGASGFNQYFKTWTGSALTEKMRIQGDGNVGIGTTAPALKLDVIGLGGAPATSGTAQQGALRLEQVSNSNVLDMGTINASPWTAWIQSTDRTALGSNYPLALNPNGGNVGIGTTTPAGRLDVGGGQIKNIATPTENADAATKSYVDSVVGGGATGLWLLSGNNLYASSTSWNIGIGTTVPTYKLHLVGDGISLRTAALTGTTYSGSSFGNSLSDLIVAQNGSSATALFTNGIAYAGQIGTDAAYPLQFATNNSVAMTILSGGNVGIGTTGPGTNLVVSPTTGVWTEGIRVTRTSGLPGQYIQINNYDGWSHILSAHTSSYPGIQFDKYNGTTVRTDMVIDNSGNVGIATTTPSYKLDVVGTSQFSQPVIVGTPTQNAHAATKSYVDSVVGGSGGIGAGTSGQTLRHNGTGWVGDSTLYNNGTNVGIGTVSPSDVLHVGSGGAFRVSDASGVYFLRMTPGNGEIYAYNNPLVLNSASGSNVLIANGGGSVGIGNVSPSSRLHVSGSVIVDPASTYGYSEGIRINKAPNSYSVIHFGGVAGSYNNTNAGQWTMGSDNAATSKFFLMENGNTFLTVLPTSGNVGIGTTTPGAKLEIKDSAGPSIYGIRTSNRFGFSVDNSAVDIGARDAGDVYIMTGAGTRVVSFLSTGNVGIATTTPSYKLDVEGTSQFSQPVIVGTPTNASHAATKSYVDSSVTGAATQWTTTSTGVYYNLGNVGIGTVSPNKTLQIEGSLGVSYNGASNFNVSTYGYTTQRSAWITQLSGTGDHANVPLSIVADIASTRTANYFNVSNLSGATGGIFTIYKDGNVGIGTAAPAQKLEISGDQVRAQITSTNGGDAALIIKRSIDTGVVISTGNIAANDLYIAANGNTVLYAKNTGNVGIGTTAPGARLDVNGNIIAGRSDTGRISLYDTGGSERAYLGLNSTELRIDSDSTLYLAANNTTALTITPTAGNVGIATTTPSYKLDVEGTSQFSQPVIVGTPTQNAHATTKSYVDSMFTGSGQWTTNGGLVYLTSTTQNVGIGTTGPNSKLEVVSAEAIPFRITNPFTPDAERADFAYLNNSTSGNSLRLGSIASSGGVTLQGTVYSPSATKVSLLLNPDGGNVGIGTTAPAGKLHVAGNIIQGWAVGESTTRFVGQAYAGDYPSSYSMGMETVPGTRETNIIARGADTSLINLKTGTAPTTRMTINHDGNVGIATTTPLYTLSVNGTGAFNQPIFVGTPTNAGHAATKSYVDSIVGGGAGTGSFSTLSVSGTSTFSGNIWFGGAAYSSLNMNGNNIVGVNKITASVIDPVYDIDGVKYATYGSDTIGIKTSIYGKVKLISSSKNNVLSSKYTENEGGYLIPGITYSATLDFGSAKSGSDLWLFWQTVNAGNNMKDIVITLTPEFDGRAWYELRSAEKQIVIYAEIQNSKSIHQNSLSVSYHLTAPRHDTNKWGNRVKNQLEEASFILKEK